jgi:hypothetical protein
MKTYLNLKWTKGFYAGFIVILFCVTDLDDRYLANSEVALNATSHPKVNNAVEGPSFKVIIDKWKMIKVNDSDQEDEVYGWITLSDLCHDQNKPKDLGVEMAWDGHQKRNDYVSKAAGEEEIVNFSRTFKCDSGQRYNNIFIYADFGERDSRNGDDDIGSYTQRIHLNLTGTDAGVILQDSFTIDNGSSVIEVFYKVVKEGVAFAS